MSGNQQNNLIMIVVKNIEDFSKIELRNKDVL